MNAPPPLVCPTCATSHPATERFCSHCGMPLVQMGALGEDRPVTERQERARKIKPQYAEGEPVRVAGARNQTEAEFIQGLLLEEGIPSMLRRARGFDVPDFLAAGPRDVLVPTSGASAAREVLLQSDIVDSEAAAAGIRPLRLLVGLVGALGLGALITWIISQL